MGQILILTGIMFVSLAAFAGIIYLVKIKHKKKTGCCGQHTHCRHQ